MIKHFLLGLLLVSVLCSPVYAGVSFAGDGDDIQIADHNDLTPSTLSVFVWINCVDVTNCVLVNKYNSSNGQRSWDFFIDGNNKTHVTLSSSTSSFIGCTSTSNSTPVSDGTWTNVGFTYNGATRAVVHYINGAAVASSNAGTCPSSLANNTLPVALATQDNGSTSAVSMSELFISNAVLSVTEAEQLGTSKVKGMPYQMSGRLVYLPLNDLAEGVGINGATFADRFQNGHDGTGTDGDGDSLSIAETILTH